MSNLITINTLPRRDVKIEPAAVRRDWMEATPYRFAYRCLPLNIANAHGWHILNPSGFRCRWNGGAEQSAVEFEYENPQDPPAVSHFGSGIVTFHIPAVITTPEGVSTFCTGPINRPKAGIYPMSGVIETDWLQFTFTMNWQVMEPDTWIEFEKDEPYCMIFPVRLDDIEGYEMEIRSIEESPELQAGFEAYSKSRLEFNDTLKNSDPADGTARWQKHYFRGAFDGEKQATHRTALNLAQPKRT